MNLKTINLFILLMLAILSCKSPKNNPSDKDTIQFINLFSTDSNQDVSCYRIPSLIMAQNGDLIAAIDERKINCGDLRTNKDINIVIRRSEDNGVTWSEIKTIVDLPLGESASDPSMILDETTEKIFLFFNYMDLNTNPEVYYLRYISSNNHGRTWSKPIDITNQISKPEWNQDFKFITSGRGIQTQSGILLHTLVNLNNGLHVFGSKDHGETWFLIDSPIIPGDESKIVELVDETWMINSRVNKSGLRFVHTSKDKGTTWNSKADSTLIDASCNASFIRYTSTKNGFLKNRLIFSNANSKNMRENLTIKISYDEGKTWKYSKSVYAGEAAYSSLSILKNGDIGVFFEKDNYKKNVFAKITLDWLTDGADKLSKP
ncbi:glycoside hydrolase [Flavobacteriaceae bacterium]|nr:glycoside hydrolase [Flavobacteriaceae bacterium]